jgi:hypothetical protein
LVRVFNQAVPKPLQNGVGRFLMKTYPMLSFRCDDKLLKQIRKEAKRRDMNTSEFIKEAVTFHLENLAEQPQ